MAIFLHYGHLLIDMETSHQRCRRPPTFSFA